MSKTIFLFMTLVLVSSCAEVQKVKKNILGVSQSTPGIFTQIKPGITHEEMLKVTKQKPKDTFQVSKDLVLYGFEDGFVAEEKGIVTDSHEYKTIGKDETLSDLVTLGTGVVDVFKNAGWPLQIQTKGDAHVFYYRTGTLLINEMELVNTFNRYENYQVTVSAFKGSAIAKPVYYIDSSVAGIERKSLEFIEVKKYVEHLITPEKGRVTENASEANVILFVNFGVGDKRVDLLSYSTPVYHSVFRPGSTSTTNVQNQYGRNIGAVQTTTPPRVSSEYAGEVSGQIQIESFRKHLILEAVEASAFNRTGERNYFWKIITESVGPTADFRAILPVLTFASSGYIFKNTGKAVQTKIVFDQMVDYFLQIFAK